MSPMAIVKSMSNPIPRCGGLAIIIAVFIPTMFWLSDVSALSGFFIGAAIIALSGFVDDRYDLDYKWKFAGQIIGVAVFLLGNVEITKTPFLGLGNLTPWISYSIMALFILGVTNAVNLSDGLDGLAAGSSLLSLGFIGYLSYVAGEMSLALVAGATMGGLVRFSALQYPSCFSIYGGCRQSVFRVCCGLPCYLSYAVIEFSRESNTGSNGRWPTYS